MVEPIAFPSGAASPAVERIVIDGAATIRSVADIRARLLDALRRGAPVEVDAAGVEEADTSVLQTLVAARRMAEAQATAFEVAAPAGSPLADAVACAGLDAALPIRRSA